MTPQTPIIYNPFDTEGKGKLSAKTNLSAEADTEEKGARLPGSYEQQGWTGCSQGTPSQGPLAAYSGLSLADEGGILRESGPASEGGAKPARRFTFGRERRLRRKADYAALFSRGKAWANNLLVLRARPNGLTLSRLGFMVGKRVGKAVERNKIRRRLREGARSIPIKPGWDGAFIARTPAATATYHQLEIALKDLLRRARLLG